MAILGHRSATMSATYAHISDPALKEQYEKVIAAGGRLAGPAAEALLANQLDQGTVDWLKTNFFKTELELGHCLRTPAEGPLRMRPLPALLKVLHHRRVRTPATHPARSGAGTGPGRDRTRLAPRGRTAYSDLRPHP